MSTNTKKRTKDIELDENITFEDLLLSKQVLDGLKNNGYFKPSPIQLKAIPLGKLGLDMIVQAKSGTGKTCVFSIISLEHILSSMSKALQVLILAPTREVAIQISDSIKTISSNFNQLVKCHTFIGGQSINQDKVKIKSCQIAVGTPGRINHLINENLLNTSNIRLFILDEADKLLESEFQESINLIYSKLTDNKQIIFLSATYPSYMASYATRYMRSPTFVRLNIIDPSLRGIRQYYKITPYSNLTNKSFDFKIDALIKLLSSIQFQQAIIFTNYQLKAENLCKTLNQNGWPAIYTSGHIEQNQRNHAMNQLKQFKCRILVSTDLTSRGVDAQNVDLVISMDIPADPETYLHRIGRAGRYGCQGIAVSLITEKEETSQFDQIIDSYSLRISQFNNDLNDIILTHNEISEANLKDDFTIEKVKLSKDELDRSLFEYEQMKKLNKNYFEKNLIKKKQKKIELKYSIDDIEMNYISQFKTMIKTNDLIQTSDSLIYENSLKLNNCNEKLKKFKTDINFKIGKVKNIEAKNIEQIDLKNLYKWIQVDKFENESKSESEFKIDNDLNTYSYEQINSAYSFYYNHFYKYYFNYYLLNE